MGDLGSDRLPRWRLLHLPLLTALGAFAAWTPFGFHDVPRVDARVVLCAVFMQALPCATPVLSALLARSVAGAVAWAIALAYASAFVCAMLLAQRFDHAGVLLPMPLFLMTIAGAISYPVARLARAALASPRTRDVAAECAVLGAYGLFISMMIFGGPRSLAEGGTCLSLSPDRTWYASMYRGRGAAALLTSGATFVVAAAGVAWELRYRRRVRAVLAGKAPGWSALPTRDVSDAGDVPLALWLDGRAWLRATLLGASAPALRVLARTTEPTGGAYREGKPAAVPWLRVPERVPRFGLRTVVNLALAAGGAYLTALALLRFATLWC